MTSSSTSTADQIRDANENNRFHKFFRVTRLTKKAQGECKALWKDRLYPLPTEASGMSSQEVVDGLLDLLEVKESYPKDCEAIESLFSSIAQILRDWFPPEDNRLGSIATLVSLEERRDDPSFRSPLDLLFLQIEDGKRYIKGNNGWNWEPSLFKRNSDGLRPAEHIRADGQRGLAPEDDKSLALWKRYKAAPITNPFDFNLEIGQIALDLAEKLGLDEPMLPEPAAGILKGRKAYMDFVNSQNGPANLDIFERLYISSLHEAIEARNTSAAARAQYLQLLQAELGSVNADSRRETAR